MNRELMELPGKPAVTIAVSGDDDATITELYHAMQDAISELNKPGTVILIRRL